MEEKVNAIVIKTVDYGDNDKILTLFALEKGVISAKIRGVKKAGAKLKFAAEPFCFCEYIMLGRGGFNSVINASLIDSFYPLRLDIPRFYAAGTAAEFVRRFSPENLVSERLFRLFADCLKMLAYDSNAAAYSLSVFLIGALEEMGYGLNLSGCVDCGEELKGRAFFDFSVGGAYCSECRRDGAVEINLSTYRLLADIAAGMNPSADEAVYLRALRLLGRYIAENTGEKLKILEDFINI